MELWDLYTRDRKPTGETHVRGEKLPADRYHLVVHVWLKNRKGQYLISQRAADRPTHPLFWECVGGSVLQGESSLQGALREVKEEVGVDLDAANGRLLFTKIRDSVDSTSYHDILDVWLFEYDGEAHLSRALTDEVAQTRWLSPVQIRELYTAHQLVGTLSYFLRMLRDFPIRENSFAQQFSRNAAVFPAGKQGAFPFCSPLFTESSSIPLI